MPEKIPGVPKHIEEATKDTPEINQLVTLVAELMKAETATGRAGEIESDILDLLNSLYIESEEDEERVKNVVTKLKEAGAEPNLVAAIENKLKHEF